MKAKRCSHLNIVTEEICVNFFQNKILITTLIIVHVYY